MDRLSAKSYVGQLLPYQPSPNPNSTFFISTWHAPCKLLAPSAKLVQNDGEKNAFYDPFATKATHRFIHFPASDFLEI